MDIRIGNDIKLNVKLPEYIDPSMVLRITANVEKVYNYHHHNCFTNYFCPTKYTMHKNSCTSYNVIPNNTKCCLHEFFDHCEDYRNNIIAIKPTDIHPITGLFSILFKAGRLKTGLYKLTLNIQVLEEGWGRDDIHDYSIDLGPVFSISNSKDAKEGNIVINVNCNQNQDDNVYGLVDVFGYGLVDINDYILDTLK